MKAGLGRCIVVAVAMVMAGTGPVQARERVGVSHDGVTWGDHLEMPLFDPGDRWVPGDRRTRSFSVRNQGPSEARLIVTAVESGRDPVLAEDLLVRARVERGAWFELDAGVPDRRLNDLVLAQSGTARVEVQIGFAADSANATQRRSTGWRFVVTLVGDVQPADRSGGLPATGAVLSWALLWIAIALIALGAVSLSGGRARGSGVQDVR